MNCVPSEDSNQPGHLPSLIRVFTVRMKKPCRPARRFMKRGGVNWSVFTKRDANLKKILIFRPKLGGKLSFWWKTAWFWNNLPSWGGGGKGCTPALRMHLPWVLGYPKCTQRRPRLICVFAGRTVILLVLSLSGSNISQTYLIIEPIGFWVICHNNSNSSLPAYFEQFDWLEKKFYTSINSMSMNLETIFHPPTPTTCNTVDKNEILMTKLEL